METLTSKTVALRGGLACSLRRCSLLVATADATHDLLYRRLCMSTALEELPLSSIASAVVAILARVDSKGTKDCVPVPSLFRDPGDDVAYV